MKVVDDLLKAEESASKTFHPVRQRGVDAWYPGNEAAGLVVQVSHAWEDITVLSTLHNKLADPYQKRLMLKYLLIELRSVVEVFDRLASKAMQAPIFDPREKQGWREITREESDEAKRLLRTYSTAKKNTIKQVVEIRHNIGAHRGNINFPQVMKFWDSLDLDLVQPLLTAMPPAFNYIADLDLYEWNCTPEEGVVSFIGTQLRPEYFEYL